MELKPGKRYWFATNQDDKPIMSGLFTGEYVQNQAQLKTREGKDWLISKDRIYKTEDEALENE